LLLHVVKPFHLVSSTGSKANTVTRRYPKRSTTPRLHRPAPVVRRVSATDNPVHHVTRLPVLLQL